jgi:hypothetical protein
MRRKPKTQSGGESPCLLTTAQVARRCGVPRRRVNSDIDAGRLPSIRFVPRGVQVDTTILPYYVRVEDADRWIAELRRAEGLLTVEAVRRLAGDCDRKAILLAVKKGFLPVAATVFGYPRFEPSAVDRWIREFLPPGPRPQGRPRKVEAGTAA